MNTGTGLLVLTCMFSYSLCFSIKNLISLTDLKKNYCKRVAQVPSSRFNTFGPCYSSPPVVANAVISDVFNSDGSPTVTVTCTQGYLFPDLAATRTMSYECEKWRLLEDCLEVTCEAPTAASSTYAPPAGPYRHLDTVVVTCDSGYVLSDGTSTAYTADCTAQGVWNNTESCYRIACTPPTFTNAAVSPCGAYVYEDTITVNCSIGYKTSTGNDSYTSDCEEDGSWGNIPTEDCTIETCSAPDIDDADLSPASGPYNYGDEVTVTCPTGYVSTDNCTTYVTRCLANEMWSQEDDCIKVACEPFTIADATLVTTGSNEYGDNVTVTCDNGYVLPDGSSTEYTAECTATSTWDDMRSCTRIACTPPTFTNAAVSPCGAYVYEDTITVTCRIGHENSNMDNSYTSVCGADGSWGTIPTEDCTIKTCPAPNIAASTLSQTMGPYNFSTVLTVTCDAGYVSTNGKTYDTRCRNNKRWRDEDDCLLVTCPTPTINNGVISSYATAPYHYEDTITVTCDEGYELSGGSDTYDTECLADDTFGRTDSCTAEICTGEARDNTKLKDGSLPDLRYNITLIVLCADGFLTSTAELFYESYCDAGGNWTHADDCTYSAANACAETAVYNTMQTDDVIPFSVEDDVVTVTCDGAYTLPVPDGIILTYDATCEGATWDNTMSCGIRTCQDTLDSNLPSGVYKIYPDTAVTEMEVYCDNDYDMGGWTVIQLREDRSVDFNLPWTDYMNGFGVPDGNFWLGLENMYKLTNSAAHKLVFELTDITTGVAYAHYNTFSVGDEASNYTLTVSAFTAGSPNAGNSFRGSDGEQFTTPDMDNDGHADNCAVRASGGWWFRPNCGNSNLNGLYFDSGVASSARRGIYWFHYPASPASPVSLTAARMLVKLV